MENTKEKFRLFLENKFGEKSGVTASYLHSLDLLDKFLIDNLKHRGFNSIYEIEALDLISEIVIFVRKEEINFQSGKFSIFDGKSAGAYALKGFCSAAVKQLLDSKNV